MKKTPLAFLEDFYQENLTNIDGVSFTKREIDVIACILHGRTAKGTAALLSILHRTVQVHTQNIRNKLGASSREGIINFIESSDKLPLIRDYYHQLLVEHRFEKSLKEISKLGLNGASKVLIIYGIEVKDQKNLFDKLQVYLEKAGLQALISKYSEGQSKSKESALSKAHILVAEDAIKENHPRIFLNHKVLDLSNCKNYYTLVFEILLKLEPANELSLIYQSFVKSVEGYQNLSHAAPSKSFPKYAPKDSREPSKKTKLSSIRFIYFPIFLIILLFLTYFIFEPFSISYGPFSLFTTENITQDKNTYPRTWNLPRQNILFVGRTNQLEDLNQKLDRDSLSNPQKPLVISACAGLGGIGKTQLALQYIHHTNHSYTFKAWFPAEDIEGLYKNYTQLAESLGYKDKNVTKHKVLTYIKNWLSEHPGWLLVYDNVNNYEEIAPFLPESGGHIIITTRQRSWPTNFNIVSVDVMKEDEAIKLLSSFIPAAITKEESKAKKIAKTLGYLPLALAQAGAYMRQNQVSLTDYLDLYRHHEMELLMDKTLPEGENVHPVAITWDISLQAIIQETKNDYEGPLAIELLTVCAYLSPDKISHDLLLAWLQKRHPTLSSPALALNKHIGLLWKYSMIDRSDDYISIHRLVQSVLRSRLQKSIEDRDILCSTLNLQWYELLMRFFIDNENEFKLSNSFEQLIETYDRFKDKFQNTYNNTLAELDLTLSSIYFNQEKYSEYLKIINKVNQYLTGKKGQEYLHCKALYLHSAYFRKMHQYQEAESKINEAYKIFEKIKVSPQISSNDLKNLKAKLNFNKVNICYAKNRKKSEAERDYQEIENGIKLIRESISICAETHSRRDWLREIEMLGRLLVLSKQGQDVVREFKKHNTLIENVTDDRTKMLFYLTYSDAYLIQGDLKNALSYCHKAKALANKLGLSKELENIESKEKKITGVL